MKKEGERVGRIECCRILGADAIPLTPRMPIVMNHASITGPKMPPMKPVPLR